MYANRNNTHDKGLYNILFNIENNVYDLFIVMLRYENV